MGQFHAMPSSNPPSSSVSRSAITCRPSPVGPHQRRGGRITPSEVLFEATALHACLAALSQPSPSPAVPSVTGSMPSPADTSFPALNAPLVAWAMVARLGLPFEVRRPRPIGRTLSSP